MTRRTALLFPAALGFSAAAHLLVLFFAPYTSPATAERRSRPVPVRLLDASPRPRNAQAAPRQTDARAQPPVPSNKAEQELPPEPQREPLLSESPLEVAPPEIVAGPEAQPEASSESSAVPQTGDGAESSALSEEIAATQALLSSLRGRIEQKIRYPPLARANGWKGTVLLEIMLDGQGRLLGVEVRRTSGYTILDRAAASLVRSVTPVDNPLERPLRIEIPVVYELK